MDYTNYVFILENDPSARHGLVRLLTAAGQNVRDYISVEDFLTALEPGICGCLILDAEMPGKSGKELLEELKSRNTNLSIIIVSARDDRSTKQKSRELKAVGFFRKPVDGTAMIDAIEWVLEEKNRKSNSTNVNNS